MINHTLTSKFNWSLFAAILVISIIGVITINSANVATKQYVDSAVLGTSERNKLNDIKVYNLHYKNANGAGLARSLIQTELYQNEDYFIQIDAHTKFNYVWVCGVFHIIGNWNTCSF